MIPPRIANQRAIIDRRALADDIAARVAQQGDVVQARTAIVEMLRQSMAAGREELDRRLAAHPSHGTECVEGQAFLIDQLIRVIHDHVVAKVYPASNRSTGERIAVVAVGGYGRGEMAPHSDVDIAFVTPNKPTAWCEQVIEAMLYFLWDLGLKVGHSTRSLDELVRQAKGDVTIRTALLEGRYVFDEHAVGTGADVRWITEPGNNPKLKASFYTSDNLRAISER